MTDRPEHEESGGVLTRLAARLADGKSVDWEEEVRRSPALGREIRALGWMETITRLRAAPAPAARSEQPAEVSSGPLVIGGTWGRLRILGRLGQGSAGDVYRAFDPVLKREVALKIWRESPAYRTTGTEARRLSKVRHRAVVNVLGSERHDGLAGMWTDFLDGMNLEDLLKDRGPLPVPEVCRIGLGVCDALEAIHAAGMVHRDVKTTNVMWLADESVVLIDFGSVKELPRGVPEQTGRIRGTPLATAPELLNEEPVVAPAADVYSLGVLLYRLVTRAYPIEAKTLAGLFEAMSARRSVTLKQRCPDCDPAFVDLVDRAIAWDPANRPGVTDVRDALRRMLK